MIIKGSFYFPTVFTRQARYMQPEIETISFNHCLSGKAIRITYSECVLVALGVQYAMRMLRITLSSAACPSVYIHPHFLTNGTIF